MKSSNNQLLEQFKTDTGLQDHLAKAINTLAEICAQNAKDRGFHDDEHLVMQALERAGYSDALIGWTQDSILQAELARQASEIGEAVEAVRKPGPDPHLPEFSNFLVEEADVVIRIADTCGKRDLDLGYAIVEKLLYNSTRPYKHGKSS